MQYFETITDKTMILFTTHPKKYGQTYLQHMFLSFMQITCTLMLMAKQIVHMVFPFLFANVSPNVKSNLSDYEMVRTFTEAAGTKCSNTPKLITKERGVFLLKHTLSELHEFALTITNSTEEAHQLLKDCLGVDPTEWKERNTFELIEDQEDAICDAWVYMLNVASEFGQDVSSMMKVVMASNMAKIDPITGKCIKREEDGKILKPAGWEPPKTKEEIERQMREGTMLK